MNNIHQPSWQAGTPNQSPPQRQFRPPGTSRIVSKQLSMGEPKWQLLDNVAIPDYAFEDLRAIFQRFSAAEFRGVKGVIEICSGFPGPVLGVTICTHGNEPSGLAVAHYLLEESKLEEQLSKGSVILCLNNLEATRKSFEATNFEERLRHRYEHWNMNRLPFNVLDISTDVYDFTRTKELYASVFKSFDVAMDIHSTSSHSPPMIVEANGLSSELYRGAPVQTVLSGYTEIANSLPIMALYGGVDRDIPSYLLEAGSHEDPQAFKCAVRSVAALLHRLGMIEGSIEAPPENFLQYQMREGLRFPDESWEFQRVFTYFETLAANQIIASNGTHDFRCQEACKIVFNGPSKKITHLREEAAFLIDLPMEVKF